MPPWHRYFKALLSAWWLSLSRLVGTGQPPRAVQSQGRPLVAMLLSRLYRLLSGASWDDRAWQTGAGGGDRACPHVFGQGIGHLATVRAFEIDLHTVLGRPVEEAEPWRALARFVFCDVHLKQEQHDELYDVLRELQDGKLSEDEAINRVDRSSS